MNKLPNEIYNIDKINKIKNELPFELLEIKKSYDKFVNDIQKSDFCNSLRRYMVEKSYLESLLAISKKYNVTQFTQKWALKLSETEQKLAQFGIKINN